MRRADVVLAVNSIIHSKTFDNGMICASEQSVIVHERRVRRRFAKNLPPAAAISSRQTKLDKVRPYNPHQRRRVNAKIVGQSAHTIAALAGVNVPEDTKILIGEVDECGYFRGICA